VIAVDGPQVLVLAAVAAAVLVALLVIWRPLLFASVDEEVALARGVPVRFLSVAFMVLLALTVSIAVQTIGALLVLALLVTPAAAAMRVAGSPLVICVLSVAFAVTATVGGILIALGGALPISPYVTTISFLIYLGCRLLGRRGVAVRWSA
jgi:zinc/manganese transport system permease protein